MAAPRSFKKWFIRLVVRDTFNGVEKRWGRGSWGEDLGWGSVWFATELWLNFVGCGGCGGGCGGGGGGGGGRLSSMLKTETWIV